MKFLANMGISPATVKFLRELGHEASHLHEQHLDRMPDPEILAKARVEGAILLTSDLDFGELVAASGEQLPTVIIFRLKDMQPENVNSHLQKILEDHVNDLEQGSVLSVSENRIRVRKLPI
jgi:predicted nuclease of predicted toxin-antitoxin system